LQNCIHEALDTNQALVTVLPPEVPSLHRLEILSETLLTFLNSLKDGIVTASVWQDMEQQMIAREKAKSPPRSWEETQAWVLENLAYSPAHSVSFTFVTFMLARIANEVAPVSSMAKPADSEPAGKAEPAHAEHTQPPTPAAASFISAGTFRRKNRSSSASTSSPEVTPPNPSVARRQAVETSLATIFALVLVSAAASMPSKEKERRATDERRRSIIEPFLKMIGVDDRGPSGGRS
jgi:hypothetical protein